VTYLERGVDLPPLAVKRRLWREAHLEYHSNWLHAHRNTQGVREHPRHRDFRSIIPARVGLALAVTNVFATSYCIFATRCDRHFTLLGCHSVRVFDSVDMLTLHKLLVVRDRHCCMHSTMSVRFLGAERHAISRRYTPRYVMDRRKAVLSNV
jgi:hypothetical protein